MIELTRAPVRIKMGVFGWIFRLADLHNKFFDFEIHCNSALSQTKSVNTSHSQRRLIHISPQHSAKSERTKSKCTVNAHSKTAGIITASSNLKVLD